MVSAYTRNWRPVLGLILLLGEIWKLAGPCQGARRYHPEAEHARERLLELRSTSPICSFAAFAGLGYRGMVGKRLCELPCQGLLTGDWSKIEPNCHLLAFDDLYFRAQSQFP